MAFRDNDRDGGRGFSRDRGNRGGGRSFGGDRGRGRDGGRSFGGRGGRDGGRPQMHDAVCAECNKECQVPFRPTGDKPVLCRDCFGGKEGNSKPKFDSRERSTQNSSQGVSQAQFKELNAKVDKILEILESIGSEEDEEEFEEE